MGKFSFGKKDKDKDKAPAENPYAQPPSAADPYTRAKIQAGVATPPPGSNFSAPPPQQQQPRGGYGAMGPPPQSRGPPPPFGGNGPSSSYGSGSSKAPDNKYAGSSSGGYGDNKYGNAGGYGQNKYGDAGGSKYGAGGYGGLGRTDSGGKSNYGEKTAFGEKAGYGGAPSTGGGDNSGYMPTFAEAQAARQSTASSIPPPYEDNRYGGPSSSGYGNSGDNYGGASRGGYGDNYNRGPTSPSAGPGGYQDRQLTAEEEEEEDVQAAKEDIRQMKREDVSSTRNALRLAAQAEETGRNTLARLGAQGERIHNTEKNLDLAANNGMLAEQKARELKTLNGSMFAVHVSNPFTGAERRRRRDEEIMTKHREDRDQREASRQAAWNTSKRMEDTFRDMSINGGKEGGQRKTNLAERAKYQFEADSEDEDMENEIDNNIELLSGAAGRLNALARATGREVEEQNKHLDRIAGKVCFDCLLSEICVHGVLISCSFTERLRRRPDSYEPCQARPHSLRAFYERSFGSFPGLEIEIFLSNLSPL